MRFSKCKVVTSLAFGLLALQAPAFAAPIVLEAEVDLSLAEVRGYVTFGVFNFPQPVSIAAGDSVDMLVRFAGGKALQIEPGGTQFLTGWLYPDFQLSTPGASNYTIQNVSLSFLDGAGARVFELSSGTQSDGNAQLGPLFWGDYLTAGEALTFSGYRATYAVSYIEESPYSYSGVFLQFASLNGGRVSTISPVPEPAALPLATLGLAVVGVAGRRRSTAAR